MRIVGKTTKRRRHGRTEYNATACGTESALKGGGHIDGGSLIRRKFVSALVSAVRRVGPMRPETDPIVISRGPRKGNSTPEYVGWGLAVALGPGTRKRAEIELSCDPGSGTAIRFL